MTVTTDRTLDVLDDLIGKARRAGADAADAVQIQTTALSLAQRLGKPEKLERAEAGDVGLRVFIGQRMAIASTADLRPASLDALVERAVAMAREVPEDPYCGLPDAADQAHDWPAIELEDPNEPPAESLTEMAGAAEDAALAVDGVTNSEGAEASWTRTAILLANSNGFAGSYARTGSSLAVSVVAGEGTAMETDYDFTGAVFIADLLDPADVGRSAGERAVARLGARKVDTAKVPVIFDPRVSRSLLGHLVAAISGPAVARGTSFLKDRMDQPVFAPGITVLDEPHLPRGLRSKAFDGEGLANHRLAVVEDGALKSWILDLRSARQLGLSSTGHAARGVSSPPSPAVTNFSLQPGVETPDAMIADIDQGFYVTQLMGQGVNPVTGDYSRGASGFWIENGAIAYPVSEVTIAGNLKAMFANLTPASDLVRKTGVDAPTVRVDGMTVAGR
jgi:PmbA protein